MKVVLTIISCYILFLAFFSRMNADDRAVSIVAGLIMVAVLWGVAFGARALLRESRTSK